MLLRRDDSLDITLLVGDRTSKFQLLNAARAIAGQLRAPRVFWLTPRAAPNLQLARTAGMYLDDDGLLIYAHSL
jgi:hypothetical protein